MPDSTTLPSDISDIVVDHPTSAIWKDTDIAVDSLLDLYSDSSSGFGEIPFVPESSEHARVEKYSLTTPARTDSAAHQDAVSSSAGTLNFEAITNADALAGTVSHNMAQPTIPDQSNVCPLNAPESGPCHLGARPKIRTEARSVSAPPPPQPDGERVAPPPSPSPYHGSPDTGPPPEHSPPTPIPRSPSPTNSVATNRRRASSRAARRERAASFAAVQPARSRKHKRRGYRFPKHLRATHGDPDVAINPFTAGKLSLAVRPQPLLTTPSPSTPHGQPYPSTAGGGIPTSTPVIAGRARVRLLPFRQTQPTPQTVQRHGVPFLLDSGDEESAIPLEMYQRLQASNTPMHSLNTGLVEIEFAAAAGRLWLRMRIKPEATEPTIGLRDMLRLNVTIDVPRRRVYYTSTTGPRFSPISVETVSQDF